MTLYADWVKGSYQDFENFTVVTENGKNPGGTDGVASIEENSQNAYSGTDVFKLVGDADTNGRVIVSQTVAEKLSAFADFEDQITISFKYKLVSGSASFYLRTSTVSSNVNALPKYTNSADKTVYPSGYEFYEPSLAAASDSWQTFSDNFSVISEEALNETSLDKESVFGYTQMWISIKSSSVVICVAPPFATQIWKIMCDIIEML